MIQLFTIFTNNPEYESQRSAHRIEKNFNILEETIEKLEAKLEVLTGCINYNFRKLAETNNRTQESIEKLEERISQLENKEEVK